jgi:hypothetical protein
MNSKNFNNIKSTLEEITVQGLSNIFKTKRRISKFIWFILLVVSSTACITYIYITFVSYFEYQIVTTISSIYDIPAVFPSISICSFFDKNFNFTMLKNGSRFNGRYLNSWQKHFHIFNDSMYGTCYRFNGGINFTGPIDIRTSSSSGYYYGFDFNVYVPAEIDYGRFIVHIHNVSTLPWSMYNKGFFVSTGSYNYFVVKRAFEKKLEEPYNNCLKNITDFKGNNSLIERLLVSSKSYLKKDCISMCRNLKYFENNTCNCPFNNLKDDLIAKCSQRNTSIISPTTRKCTNSFIEEFQANDPNKVCADYCPVECDSFDLLITHFSQVITPTGNVSNDTYLVSDFKTYENVSKTFLSIAVYYDDLKYILTEQKPKIETFDLISNIGGYLGLFLGKLKIIIEI